MKHVTMPCLASQLQASTVLLGGGSGDSDSGGELGGVLDASGGSGVANGVANGAAPLNGAEKAPLFTADGADSSQDDSFIDEVFSAM